MIADVFYVELAHKADGPLVELAIGNGRVAIPAAKATGQRVIGIDSSFVHHRSGIGASFARSRPTVVRSWSAQR